MIEATIQLPRLYPKQRAVFYSPARIVICEASTKAGKSVGALAWCLDLMTTTAVGKTGIWVSPVYSQAKVMFDRVKRWLMRADPEKRIWDSHDTEMWIKVGASRLVFKGSENYDSIYGTDYAFAVMDEASRQREEAWHAVRSTLTATKGPVRIIGNAKGRKNWAYQLGARARSGAEGLAYFRLTAWDAVDGGILDRAEIESAKRDLPEAVFRELYLAEPSDDGGNPFGLQHIAACVAPLSGAAPVAWGVDLAKSQDWTVCCGVDDAGAVCRFERWQGPWGITRERLRALLANGEPAKVDSTGVGDPIVEDLQRGLANVEGVKFTSQSKQQLMEGLASAIQRRSVTFPDGPVRDELETFEYEYTRTGVRYSAPDGLHDDCVCALALAVSAHAGSRAECWSDSIIMGGDDW